MGQNPVDVAPNVYSVLFENDKVRLLEVREKPGDGSSMHSHPDYLVYGLGDGKSSSRRLRARAPKSS